MDGLVEVFGAQEHLMLIFTSFCETGTGRSNAFTWRSMPRSVRPPVKRRNQLPRSSTHKVPRRRKRRSAIAPQGADEARKSLAASATSS
jgi:hypothetical protein